MQKIQTQSYTTLVYSELYEKDFHRLSYYKMKTKSITRERIKDFVLFYENI